MIDTKLSPRELQVAVGKKVSVTILIVEDQTMLRESLAQVIGHQSGNVLCPKTSTSSTLPGKVKQMTIIGKKNSV
jgi:hypothetical protein